MVELAKLLQIPVPQRLQIQSVFIIHRFFICKFPTRYAIYPITTKSILMAIYRHVQSSEKCEWPNVPSQFRSNKGISAFPTRCHTVNICLHLGLSGALGWHFHILVLLMVNCCLQWLSKVLKRVWYS